MKGEKGSEKIRRAVIKNGEERKGKNVKKVGLLTIRIKEGWIRVE
jgi:hypothetical protein